MASALHLVDDLLTADTGGRLTALWLQVHEASPDVTCCLSVIPDLGIWVQAKNLRAVGQRQRLYVFWMGDSRGKISASRS